MKQVLDWVPLCPVNAKVHLCWMTDDKQKCVNILDSLSTAHNQVSKYISDQKNEIRPFLINTDSFFRPFQHDIALPVYWS